VERLVVAEDLCGRRWFRRAAQTVGRQEQRAPRGQPTVLEYKATRRLEFAFQSGGRLVISFLWSSAAPLLSSLQLNTGHGCTGWGCPCTAASPWKLKVSSCLASLSACSRPCCLPKATLLPESATAVDIDAGGGEWVAMGGSSVHLPR
jgi:hypothetical protein